MSKRKAELAFGQNRELRAATIVVLGLLALVGIQIWRTRRPVDSIVVSIPAEAQLDINRASVAELVHLPGIGPELAARIVADRAARGRFRDPDDLGRVHGIGPKTILEVTPYLTLPSASTAESLVSTPRPAD